MYIIKGSWEAIFRDTDGWDSSLKNTLHNTTSHNPTSQDTTSHKTTSHNTTSHNTTVVVVVVVVVVVKGSWEAIFRATDK